MKWSVLAMEVATVTIPKHNNIKQVTKPSDIIIL